MFAGAAREVVFSNPEVIKRVNADFIPVALKAALVNQPPDDEEGLLYIEGRVDDQLNVGGLKINPEDIDQVLAAHPSVLEAGAFVLANSEGRELLASALVLRDVAHAEAVRQHAQQKLGPLAPKQYFIVASLPRTITGKLRRAELTAQFSKYEDDALS